MEPIGLTGQGGPSSEIYRFDDIVVDGAAHTVLKAGQPQTLEPKAFSVLLVLLRRKGELVGREELLDDVWGHRHVTPGVLTRVIAQLRHTLGDDSQRPRYIQTQHALGYRFIGQLRESDRGAEVSAAIGDPVEDAKISLNLIHVPVFYGTTFNICVDLNADVSEEALAEACKEAAFSVVPATEEGPSNVSVAGETSLYLRSPAPDSNHLKSWWLWGAADNLRVPAHSGIKLAEFLDT